MEPAIADDAVRRRVRGGRGIALPYREMPFPEALRLPRWLQAVLGGALLAGPLVGLASRKTSTPQRALRATLWTSGLAYAAAATLDLAEHFRLEKEVTGRYLTWKAIPPSEAMVHAGIIGTNLGALLLARPVKRPYGPVDLFNMAAPALFLAFGWVDELGYHRRRTQHREDLIHTTQHLAEGVMWTALYATRLFPKRHRRRPAIWRRQTRTSP